MAYAIDTYTGNASTTSYSITFPYIEQAHVIVTLDGVTKTLTTDYTFSTSSTIAFVSAPASAVVIKFTRSTSRTSRLVDYQDGSTITEAILDQDGNQSFYLAQEAIDITEGTLNLSASTDQWDAISKKITNVADPTLAQDAVSKNYLESTWLSTSDKTNLTTVAGQSAQLALLGTSDAVSDMNTLATADIIADMNTLATSDIVADLNTLAASDIVTDMNTLATSANVTAMGLLGNSTTVTNMGLLGTSDAIADINTLATADVVSDLNTLATSANVTAMGLLGTSANVTAVGLLGTSAVVTDLGILGTADVVADMNVLATADVVADMNVLGTADVVSDMNTLGTSANVTAMSNVATNIASVNNFADQYRIASSAPVSSLDVGDLYFDTTANELKVYKSSGWAAAGSTVNGTSARYNYTATAAQTTFTGSDTAGNTLAYDAGFADVYLNGVRLSAADITITSGTSVVLATGAAVGDILDIVAYGTFSVASIAASSITSGTLGEARLPTVPTTKGGTGLTAIGTAGQVIKVNSGASALEYGQASSAEVYGFSKNSDSQLIITTTNQGADSISSATHATFDDTLFSASGFVFSISNGELISTI